MTGTEPPRADKAFTTNAMAAFIQISAVVILVAWCFSIVRPFVSVVIWGMIISVAIYPLHQSLTPRLGGRQKLSATLLVIIGLAIILLPAWMLAGSAVNGYTTLSEGLREGNLQVPAPNESVAGWPIVGERLYETWSDAAENLGETLNRYGPQLRSVGLSAVGFAGGISVGILQFILSVIIGGALLTSASSGYRLTCNVAKRLTGSERGTALTDLSILTIRSVVKGVLGVAAIQAGFAALGLVIIDVPAAGLLAGAVLVLAVVQLPPWLVLLPVAIWYYSVAEAVPATVFLVYAVIVSLSDAVLKPMLLGRGLDTPMLVILIGAIGGAITEGIVGLFVGAVVLALGYELFTTWAAPDAKASADEAEGADAPGG
jgi:predicted PurR-regulated permease PerM